MFHPQGHTGATVRMPHAPEPVRKGRRRGRVGSGLLIAGAVAWALAPAVVVGLLTARSVTLELAPELVVRVPVEANRGQVSEPVAVALDWRAQPPLVAPAWNGLVQSIPLRAGDSLDSGDPVVVIDGITRIAWASKAPFYRGLALGDSGPDARDLNSMLTALGLPAGDGDRVTWSTLEGIAGLALHLGVPDAAWVDAFDPSWIVFLPAPGAVIASVDVVLGAPGPAAGTVLAKLEDSLARAFLSAPAPRSAADGEDAPVVHGEPVVALDGQVLTVAGTPLELADDRSTLSPAALPELLPLIAAGADSARGQLSRPAAAREWVVPAAAIVAGGEGRTCVVTGAADSPRGIRVVVVGSEPGRAIITGDLGADDLVTIRPPAELRSCA